MIKKWSKRISYTYLLLTVFVALLAGLRVAAIRVAHEAWEIIPHPHPVFHVEFDGYWDLSFEEARDLALYFDGLYDEMGESPYPPPSAELMHNLALEALPFFEYEGLNVLATFPMLADLYPYQDAESHSHTAGQSDCAGYVLNYRYANPFSSWHNEGTWVATAIHEMVHVQQGSLCAEVDNYYIEQTAEIVSLEVMAAMVNYGNRDMTYALVRKLRGMAASAAYGIALNAGELEKYEALRAQMLDDPYQDAGYNKSRRWWVDDPERLNFILQAYSVVPLERIVQAILYNDSAVEGLIIPPGQVFALKHSKSTYIPGPPFILDDLAYFLEHAEELVDRYILEEKGE